MPTKRQSLRGKLSEGTTLPAPTTAAVETPSGAPVVRPAAEHDIIDIITLLSQAGRPMPVLEQITAVAAIYHELMGQETALALVAEDKNQVLGVLLGTLRARANWLTPELWIADVAVAAGAHAEVGRSLLTEALAVAGRWGCFRVTYEAANVAGLTPDLLNALGFAETGLAYSLFTTPVPLVGTRGVDSSDKAHDGVPITYRESSV